MALACDATRVVTMAWNHPNTWPFLKDANGATLQSSDWHEQVVHRSWHTQSDGDTPASIAEAQSKLNTGVTWLQNSFAHLLERLKSVKDGEGTLLDNTLVYYCNEFGATHENRNKPYMIAGKAAGQIKPGRWLRHNGVAHNRLLLTLLRAFVPENDPIHQTFGDPKYNAGGPLPGILG